MRDPRSPSASRALFGAVLALPASLGCGAGAEGELGSSRAAVVYERDDRVEVYQETITALRSAAIDVSVAVVPSSSVTVAGDGRVQLDPASLKEQLSLCDGEPFADQPAPARCSGVLLGGDLVLTAAHCVRDVPCDEMALVRRFAYAASDELREIRVTDVARCARVIHREPARLPDGEQGLDWAFIQLDRGFAGTDPVEILAPDEVHVREPVALVGNGQGLATKIDATGTVVEVGASKGGQFLSNVANFAGGSGSGVFDLSGRLLGVAVNGARDYDVTGEGCRVTRVLSDAEGQEAVTYADRALDGLCSLEKSSEVCRGRSREPSCCIAGQRARDASPVRGGWLGCFMAFWIVRRFLRRSCRSLGSHGRFRRAAATSGS